MSTHVPTFLSCSVIVIRQFAYVSSIAWSAMLGLSWPNVTPVLRVLVSPGAVGAIVPCTFTFSVSANPATLFGSTSIASGGDASPSGVTAPPRTSLTDHSTLTSAGHHIEAHRFLPPYKSVIHKRI